MNRKKIKFIILLLIAIIIQLFVMPYFEIDRVSPDVITIVIVYSSFYFGRLNGTIFGFVGGFIFDLVSGGIIGSGMFAKTLVGFLAGFFQNTYLNESEYHFIKYLLIMFFCAGIDSFFFSLFGFAEIKLSLINLFFTTSIFPGIYTTIISIPVYFLRPKGFFNE